MSWGKKKIIVPYTYAAVSKKTPSQAFATPQQAEDSVVPVLSWLIYKI